MNRTFWQHAQAYGITKLNEGVKKLRNINEQLTAKCLHPKWANRIQKTWADVSITRYNLRPGTEEGHTLCRQATLPEQTYLKILPKQCLHL